jgi:hypothetical protein
MILHGALLQRPFFFQERPMEKLSETSLETERVRPVVADLVRVGFFRLSGIDTTLSHDELAGIAEQESEFYLKRLDDGWYLTNWEDTLAGVALRRIAGVVDGEIPMADVAAALMKTVAYGPAGERNHQKRRARGRAWMEAYESNPSPALVAELCALSGVAFDPVRKLADFSTCDFPVHPTDREMELLYALEESPYSSMPTSRLCRKLEGRPSRTWVDALVEGIPFILKDRGQAARIIGTDGIPDYALADDIESFASMRKSSDGSRVMLEFRITDECVEGNSFNIPQECREEVHGVFIEVSTDREIKYNKDGRDARKVTGIGKSIRMLFPDYLAKETAYIILDRVEHTARVEVISMHAADKLEAIERMLEEGIRQGPILEASDAPEMAA